MALLASTTAALTTLLGNWAILILIPVIAEELIVEKRTVERGRVRIRKLVETHEERVDEALLREDVTVERVSMYAA